MYRVEWSKDVIAKIAIVWDRSTSHEREAIHVAAETLDEILLTNPAAAGESRESEDVRVLAHMPLVINYRIDAAKRHVRVFSVNVYRREK
jgi:hypothetical protein